MPRLLSLPALLLILAVSGCDAAWVAPSAFSGVDAPLAVTFFDASGEVAGTGEIDLERSPQPGAPAQGTYRIEGAVPVPAPTGGASAAYWDGADECAEQLQFQVGTYTDDGYVADAGLVLVTSCAESELRGEWFEVTIRGQEARGTFTLE